ncbi:hypothetical protein [Xanthomonas albilineans]|uniref:Hypothetical phage-related protein n=1 Tax=Xanthomonas albilineans (strain GPE PC73 / CFBP 7063) TaxID=380358 RepID=D2U9V6_XANAP|nr:hypothetical protein [Xanthomonas albilineans]CBA14767.1 hypothetical phage-related protein [Xanthomonas albilineans GPE PC73]
MKDFSFQGIVYLGTRLPGGKPGALTDAGDVPKCDVALQVQTEKRTESRSGNRLTSAVLQKSKESTIVVTLNHATFKNWMMVLYGTKIVIPAGSITGELLPPNLMSNDVVALAQGAISSLVITDSAGTPATLVENTHYAITSPKGGVIKIINPSSFVQPFKAAYAHDPSINITMFTAPPPEVYLFLDGINTIDNSRVRTHLYRVQFDPGSSLPLINESFGQFELPGTVLFDSEAEADALMGGFGKIELVGETG